MGKTIKGDPQAMAAYATAVTNLANTVSPGASTAGTRVAYYVGSNPRTRVSTTAFDIDAAFTKVTELAKAPQLWARMIEALDRDGDHELSTTEADASLLSAAQHECRVDPEATASQVADRARKRVAAQAAAKRLSRLAEDHTETTDEIIADLAAIRSYLGVAKNPQMEAKRLLADVGPNDIALASQDLQTRFGARLDGGDDPASLFALRSMSSWVSLGLEDDPARAKRWVDTIASDGSDFGRFNTVTLTILASESSPGTGTLSAAVWDRISTDKSLADPVQGTFQSGYTLYRMTGTSGPLSAIVASSGRRPQLGVHIMDRLTHPPKGSVVQLEDLLHPGQWPIGLDVSPEVSAHLLRQYYTNHGRFPDGLGLADLKTLSDAGRGEKVDPLVAQALSDCVVPSVSQVVSLTPDSDDDGADAATRKDVLDPLVRTISGDKKALQRLVTGSEVYWQARFRAEATGDTPGRLADFNESYERWLRFMRDSAAKAGTTTEDWGLARKFAGLAAGQVFKVVAVPTLVATGGSAAPILIGLGGMGLDRALDAGQKALEQQHDDGRSIVVDKSEVALQADAFSLLLNYKHLAKQVTYEADVPGEKRISNPEDLKELLVQCQSSGNDGIDARARLKTFAGQQDSDEIINLTRF